MLLALAAVAALAASVGSAARAAPAAPAGEPAYPGIGRVATPEEVVAWDIDVRPDFAGLPAGSGSVAQGMDVWEGKCASCHGVFGESNEVFSPLVGGTTKDDVERGRVARLTDAGFPGRTTLMKVSTVSTLWDYIRRAMPWNAPKSLTTAEVYAVTAYLLNMGGVVPDDYVLSDRNIADVQQRLPNRNGMTTDHAMWPGKAMGSARPDVVASACMRDCGTEPKVASSLPDFARNAHGNLARQNRLVGAQFGADTSRPPPASPAAAAAAVHAAAAGEEVAAASGEPTAAAAVQSLMQQHACTSCHGQDRKIVGPAFRDIAKKYAGRADAPAYLSQRIRAGGSGRWGDVAMPPQTLAEADADRIARWLADGAAR